MVVSLDGGLGLGYRGGDGGQLGLPVAVGLAELVLGGGDGLGQEGLRGGVEGDQGVQEGGVEGVGVQARVPEQPEAP